MGKKTHLVGEAAGKVAKLVGRNLNAGEFAGGTAKKVAKYTDDTVKRMRRVSKRRKFLGKTPGKNSRTGREVIERMRTEGTIVKVDGEDMLKWEGDLIPLSKCDMGHSPMDAVRYWNEIGIKEGPRSQAVRDWMLASKNYELQPSSWNRSQGAKLGETYNDF